MLKCYILVTLIDNLLKHGDGTIVQLRHRNKKHYHFFIFLPLHDNDARVYPYMPSVP